jgi:hypothetical protein
MSRDAMGGILSHWVQCLNGLRANVIFDNPAENVLAQRRVMVREQDRRDLFTDDELELIFSADWFKKGAGTPNQYGRYTSFRPFHYWLPLLALYVGASMSFASFIFRIFAKIKTVLPILILTLMRRIKMDEDCRLAAINH